MADYTVAHDAVGAYELALTAGTPVSIEFKTQNDLAYTTAQVLVLTATAPVYARLGATAAPKDARSVVVTAGSWVDIPLGYGNRTLSLVSTATATISVYRT